MGLAASQARLLLLTARKNDVEGQMMSVSNEKLALSRQSAQLSRNYSDSLNAQKLTWSNGSDSQDLSYALLMSPNAVEGQYIFTNSSSGAVLLDPSIIAKTGLGSSGSGSDLSSKFPTAGDFVVACMGVSGSSAATIKNNANLIVNQGTSTTTASSTFTTNYNDSDVFSYLGNTDNGYGISYYVLGNENSQTTYYHSDGSSQVLEFFTAQAGTNDGISGTYLEAAAGALKSYVSGITSDASSAVLAVLEGKYSYSNSTISQLEAAAAAAKQDTVDFYSNNLSQGNYMKSTSSSTGNSNTINAASGINGVADDCPGDDELYVDVSQVIKTFLAYFDAECDKLNGGTGAGYTSEIVGPNVKTAIQTLTTTTSGGYSSGGYNPSSGSTSTYLTVTTCQSPGQTNRKSVGGTGSSCTEQSKLDATVNGASNDLNSNGLGDTYEEKYYINLYNAIKNKGWEENANIMNSKYLQNQVMYGNITISKLNSSAGWDTISSNATNSPLETVSDDSTTNEAEAKYSAAKDELDYKESQLDIKMNDLDTERSAIETEVDSVQKLINKNIESSFKLFQNG